MVNRSYYQRYILPWFHGRQITDIEQQDVQLWFASLRARPFSADRSVRVLSVIMRQAEVYGYRLEGSNPCKGIRRYRRRERERFLSPKELQRLTQALERHTVSYPMETTVIRLLLLTGCRKSEIGNLRWSFCHGRPSVRRLPSDSTSRWTSPRLAVPLAGPAADLHRQVILPPPHVLE